MEGSIPFR